MPLEQISLPGSRRGMIGPDGGYFGITYNRDSYRFPVEGFGVYVRDVADHLRIMITIKWVRWSYSITVG